MARKYIDQIRTLEGVDSAYEALQQYTTGWRTWLNPHRRFIRRHLNKTSNQYIVNNIFAGNSPVETISSTSKLAAVFYMIQKNDDSRSEFDQGQLLIAAGLEFDNREQTFITLLRSYSAPWYKRLFTGDIKNRYVRDVREILRAYDDDGDLDAVLNSIDELDMDEDDPLHGLYGFFNDHCTLQDQRLADKTEREWRESCDQYKDQFINRMQQFRKNFESKAWIFNKSFELLGRTQEYKDTKVQYDAFLVECDEFSQRIRLIFDSVTNEEFDGFRESVEVEYLALANKKAQLDIYKLEENYYRAVKPINILKEEFRIVNKEFHSRCRLLRLKASHGTIEEFDVKALQADFKATSEDAVTIIKYSELEWLNKSDEINALIEKMRDQNNKFEAWKQSRFAFRKKIKRKWLFVKSQFDAARSLYKACDKHSKALLGLGYQIIGIESEMKKMKKINKYYVCRANDEEELNNLLARIEMLADKYAKYSPSFEEHNQVVHYLADIFTKEYMAMKDHNNPKKKFTNYILPLIYEKMRDNKISYQVHKLYADSDEKENVIIQQLVKLRAIVELNKIAEEAGVLFNRFMSGLFDDDLPEPSDNPNPKQSPEFEMVLEGSNDEAKQKADYKKLFKFILKKLLELFKQSRYNLDYKVQILKQKIERLVPRNRKTRQEVQHEEVIERVMYL